MSLERFELGSRMSQAVVHNNTIYLAGQVGNAQSTIEQQTAEALASVDRLLKIAGSSKSNILQATIWISPRG